MTKPLTREGERLLDQLVEQNRRLELARGAVETLAEQRRITILALRDAGVPWSEAARRLGVSRAAIAQAIKKNGKTHPKDEDPK